MKTPRVLLIRPPEAMGPVGRQILHEPHNLMILAAVAKKAGAEVRLADYAVSAHSRGNLKSLLNEFPADLVGFSCMTQDIHAAAELAAQVKQATPGARTIAGGVHPSVLPGRTLEEFPSFDLVAAGEGEQTLTEIIERMTAGRDLQGTKGIAYREADRIVVEEPRLFMKDLSSVPLPARDLAPMETYLSRTSTPGIGGMMRRVGTIFSSRGCPHRCIFCSGWQTCGKNPRPADLDLLAEEVKVLVGKYGAGHITVKDDTFTLDKEHTAAVGELLAKAGVTWDCKTRINALDLGLLAEMKRQGCIRLHMGVESGSDRILKLIQKQTTVEQVNEAFAVTRELGFERTAYFIIGAHPSETAGEFLQSRRLCKQIKPEYGVFSVIVPYPGTETYRLMKQAGQIESEDWRRYNPFVQIPAWRTDHFSARELMALQKKAMTEIYLSLYFIGTKLKTLRHPAAWGYWGKSALDFFRYRRAR